MRFAKIPTFFSAVTDLAAFLSAYLMARDSHITCFEKNAF